MRNFKRFLGLVLTVLLAASVFSCAAPKAGGKSPMSRSETEKSDGDAPTSDALEARANEETSAYMFVHFVGEGDENGEQIYFSVSQDGTSWRTLNEAKPVLKSDLGEKGVRDPHIIRSPDGNKFYLIATDLSIFHRNWDWGGCQTAGSKSIIIWESDDLVNWSAPRIREIARSTAGCTWAPESVYDDERGEYMVFWASKTKEDNYWTHRIYRCYTADFDTFTEPELYMESDVSVIDTTFIKEGDTYYRFTKDEDVHYVYMEKSDSLNGDFEAVSTYTLNGVPGQMYTGYEGPTVYKLNGEDKWCLLLDNYGKSAGYKPFVTDDITTGRFVSGTDFDFGGTLFRHGTVLPITQSEYDALMAEYPVDGKPESGELVFSLDFDDDTLGTSVGAATATGTLSYGDGVNGGRAVQLTSGNYITVTEGKDGTNPLAGLGSFTVSFAIKASGKSWWFFAAPNANKQVWQSEKYIGVLDDNRTLTCERYNSNNQGRPAAATYKYDAGSGFTHVTVVYRDGTTILYVNGTAQATVASSVDLAAMLGNNPVIQLGKANWDNGEFADGYIDAFRIHNYAMSAEEVSTNYRTVMGL